MVKGQPTQAELLEMWNRLQAQKAKDKVNSKRVAKAISILKNRHLDEYKTILAGLE